MTVVRKSFLVTIHNTCEEKRAGRGNGEGREGRHEENEEIMGIEE